MRRLFLLTLLAVLALPAAALAAPAKLSPNASAVSAAGVTTIEAANPNKYALRGTATVAAGGRTIATRAVRLGKRSVATLRFQLGAEGIAALRTAGGRATIALKLRRAGGRKTTAKRTLTLELPAGPEAPQGPAPGGQPQTGQQQGGQQQPSGDPQGGPAPTPQPDQPAPTPAPVSNRWTGRMGDEGDYDEIAFTVSGGRLTMTKTPTVPVMCFENGGWYRSALSFELFTVEGPWTIGTDESVQTTGVAVNQLVSGGERGITYKVENTTQEAGKITGTLGMSFFHSSYDVFTNTITFINCSGSQSFEAIPAP